MKKILVLFVCIFMIVQLYGQQNAQESSLYPTVSFKWDEQSDSILIVREELPNHFELCYGGKSAGKLSASIYWDEETDFEYGNPKTDARPKSDQAWEAWLCTRIIPEEVKVKLNLSSREDSALISYLLVDYELQIMVRFDKSEKIVQVDFFFQNRNLYQSVSEDQLISMYKGIIKNCRLIDGIYRLPSKGVEAKEFEVCETYVLTLSLNSSLRWAKECQEYNPKVWDETLEYFDSLEMELNK